MCLYIQICRTDYKLVDLLIFIILFSFGFLLLNLTIQLEFIVILLIDHEHGNHI